MRPGPGPDAPEPRRRIAFPQAQQALEEEDPRPECREEQSHCRAAARPVRRPDYVRDVPGERDERRPRRGSDPLRLRTIDDHDESPATNSTCSSPNSITSPGWRSISVTGLPLTSVPLVEFRSRSTKREPSQSITAWERDIIVSSAKR